MLDFIKTTIDKFTFRVATDRFYTREGLWARQQAGEVWVGLTDFTQQHSGDVAFAEVKPEGTTLKAGDDLISVETIKVNTILGSPVGGTVLRVNPAMEDRPEVINMDPYGEGWMAIIKADGWEADKKNLLDPQAYFEHMKRQAEDEVAKL